MRTIRREIVEPERVLEVCGSYDVAVVGGGVAGVSAALAAARTGARVCFIEKLYAPGGLATLGNVTVYLPLCDGRGRQVIGGLAEELLVLSVADLRCDDNSARFAKIPECWLKGGDRSERGERRYRASFNPTAFMLSMEKLLVDSGVDLLYDTLACGVARGDRRIDHLILENKSGRRAMGVGAVVDATGDADICALAGETTVSLDSNVLSSWFYTLADRVLRQHPMSNKFNASGERDGVPGPYYRGDVAEDVTRYMIDSRKMIRGRIEEMRELAPGVDVQPFNAPTFPSFRMTRRLVGAITLRESDTHRWFDDTVSLFGSWREAGPVWALPLGAIRGVENSNLAAAGRCISADGVVWDAARAIPVCAASGEAAGVAAAMAALEFSGDMSKLPYSQLSAELSRRGVLLEPELCAASEIAD